jgi:hypothetical protein
LLLLFVINFSFAQKEMETDRPDQTECSSLLEPRSIQVETGALYTHDAKSKLKQFNYPTTLIRIGVFKAAELRIIAGEFEQKELFENDSLVSTRGFHSFEIGTKIQVCDENGIIPQIACLGHVEIPLGKSNVADRNKIGESFRFSMSHTLSKRFSLGYNLGLEWEPAAAFPAYIYTFTAGAEISAKWGCYIETFGNFSYQDFPESFVDGGITFSPLKNWQLDASAGYGMNQYSDDYFLSIGLSFRLPR